MLGYQQALKKAEMKSGLSGIYQPLIQKLNKMQDESEEAFNGSVAEQAVKRNRAAKASYSDSLTSQRGY